MGSPVAASDRARSWRCKSIPHKPRLCKLCSRSRRPKLDSRIISAKVESEFLNPLLCKPLEREVTMNPRSLRTWHRRVALTLAPFLLLQALSGVLLSLGLTRRLTELIEQATPLELTGAWTVLLARVHFGRGWLGDLYHGLLFVAICWVVVTGVWIWVDLTRRRAGTK